MPIDQYIHMECGCAYPIEDKAYPKFCPEHYKPKKYFTRPCERCGKIQKVKHLNHICYMCDDCDAIVQQSKVVYNNHGLRFIDSILWHKIALEVLMDISVNAQLGYEEIQIDAPIRVQHQRETIVIDMKQKIENLKFMKTRL